MAKEVRKTLRFSADEMKEIEDKLLGHGINFSEFARSAILKKKVHSKVTFELVGQVQKIGVNLNQIAKAVNEKKSDLPNSEVVKKLIEIEKALRDLQ